MKQEANCCGKAYKTKKQDANYPVQRQKVHMVNDHIVASATWESTESRLCWDVHSYSRQYRAYWTV
jgi:hypothetical protein